jgi:DNA-binding GntR family transcriptional regulator
LTETEATQSFLVERPAATLRHSVTESIRQAIAVGRFRPGARMPERELCEMTGVSRTLVREALRQLESEGLIEVIAHKGPVVAQMTAAQAMGVYQVREVLEGLAARLFAQHASDADRQKLRSVVDDFASAATAAERVTMKNVFYQLLVAGSGNEALGKALYMLNSRSMILRSRSLRTPGRWDQSMKELDALVTALEARDADRSQMIAVDHVRRAAAAAMQTFSMESGSDERES